MAIWVLPIKRYVNCRKLNITKRGSWRGYKRYHCGGVHKGG